MGGVNSVQTFFGFFLYLQGPLAAILIPKLPGYMGGGGAQPIFF